MQMRVPEALTGDPLFAISLAGLALFFLVTVAVAARPSRRGGGRGRISFLDRHGISHRLVGAAHLAVLVYGCVALFFSSSRREEEGASKRSRDALIYDIVIGLTGTAATLTAARDFPHRLVKNAPAVASGTLSEKAIVTHGEIVEHAFYQFLNLWQALYLHYMTALPPQQQGDSAGFWKRWLALLFVTSPWLVRRRFPVHSFADNWSKARKVDGNEEEYRMTGERPALETLLYRIKKAQYLVYKHVIFFGLNISVCLEQSRIQPRQSAEQIFSVADKAWRLFWLCLNTSYAMEFFLQTMVKRRALSQATMLRLNRLLMLVSSVAAYRVSGPIQWHLCVLSFFLNMLQRKQDVRNTMLLVSAAAWAERRNIFLYRDLSRSLEQ